MSRLLARRLSTFRKSHGSDSASSERTRDQLQFSNLMSDSVPPVSSTLVTTNLPTPAYPLTEMPPSLSFSTNKFIKDLEAANFERELANQIMLATKSLLLHQQVLATNRLLSKPDLDNEVYLFSAALSELTTESKVRLRNDLITLKSLTHSLDRQTESINQTLTEDINNLRSEIQLEMNGKKEEYNSDLSGLDRKVLELNNKFTILLGEVRTEIEATKWISTRRVMSAIVAVVVVVIAFVSAPRTPAPLAIVTDQQDPNYGSLREPTDKILTAEDYGIRGESEEAELSSSSAGVSPTPPPLIPNGNASEAGAPSWFWKADK